MLRREFALQNVLSKKTRGVFFSFYTYSLNKEFVLSAIRKNQIPELRDSSRATGYGSSRNPGTSCALPASTLLVVAKASSLTRAYYQTHLERISVRARTRPYWFSAALLKARLTLRARVRIRGARRWLQSRARLRRLNARRLRARRPHFRTRTRLLKFSKAARSLSLASPHATRERAVRVKPSRRARGLRLA